MKVGRVRRGHRRDNINVGAKHASMKAEKCKIGLARVKLWVFRKRRGLLEKEV